MNKILVTGGAGFIGSHIVDKLIEKFEVCIIDNLSSGKLENINKKARYYPMDITDESIENIFKIEKPDIVIHLAAQISVSYSQLNPIYDAKTNILGTLNLLKLSKKYFVSKFIAASSAAIYGNIESPILETYYPAPLSNYGISKLTTENYIINSKLNYLILRFSNVYGERQNTDGEAGVVTIFEELMKANKLVHIHGNGEQIRDFIYVKDLAGIVQLLIENNIYNEIINISTGTGLSINNLYKALSKKYHYNLPPIYDTAREGDIKISVLNNEKLMSYFPFFKFTNIEDYKSNIEVV